MLPVTELEKRAAIARTHLADCHLCPHHCGEARVAERGVCRVGTRTFIASEMLHVAEERAISPAHAVFFSGCTATCTFCTAARFAFRPTYGVLATPTMLANAVRQRKKEGARTLEFVGGEPIPHVPFVLETLAQLGEDAPPVVWNSNFYHTRAAFELLDGVVSIFLPDLKFGNDACGLALGGMPNYWNVVTEAIRWAVGHGEIIVRHLLMPGHFECCTRPALTWLAQHASTVSVSLLTQYFPSSSARGALAMPLDESDVANAAMLARELQLTLAV